MAKHRKKKRSLSIYPAERAYLVVGYSTPALNAALDRWAHLIANAVRSNEEWFTASEWHALVEAHETTLFESTLNSPQSALAVRLQDAACLYLADKWQVDLVHIVCRLETMTLIEAWAVVTVIQFYWREVETNDKCDFWKLETLMKYNTARMARRELNDNHKLTRRKS